MQATHWDKVRTPLLGPPYMMSKEAKTNSVYHRCVSKGQRPWGCPRDLKCLQDRRHPVFRSFNTGCSSIRSKSCSDSQHCHCSRVSLYWARNGPLTPHLFSVEERKERKIVIESNSKVELIGMVNANTMGIAEYVSIRSSTRLRRENVLTNLTY